MHVDPAKTEVVTLRRATAGDAAALALVGSATFLEAFTWMLPGADIVAHCSAHHTAEAYSRYLALPSTRITLAVTGDDAPVGYAMLAAPDMPDFEVRAGDTELKRIYLFSRFRGSGTPVTGHAGVRTGQALLDAAVEEARAMGSRRMILGTNAGNQRAIAFYLRNGFAEAGSRTFQVGTQRCCDLIYAKVL